MLVEWNARVGGPVHGLVTAMMMGVMGVCGVRVLTRRSIWAEFADLMTSANAPTLHSTSFWFELVGPHAADFDQASAFQFDSTPTLTCAHGPGVC